MAKLARILGAALLLCAAYTYGVLSHDNRWFPTPQLERALRQQLWRLRPARGFRDTTNRERVDCRSLAGPDTAVLLTLGQSNAANEAALDPIDAPGAYNFNAFDGRCYQAEDPLLGTTGVGSSVWTRVAAALVADGTFARVVVAPIAVGGSSVKRWAPGGDLDDRIAATLRSLEATGLPPTHVLWHQGETDVRMPGAEYGEHFRAMLEAARADGLDAPVFVAQASICKNQGSDELRRAQRELAQLPGVHEGPNTDALDRFRWRRDLCHFSGPGLDAHARAWVDVLRRAATDG